MIKKIFILIFLLLSPCLVFADKQTNHTMPLTVKTVEVNGGCGKVSIELPYWFSISKMGLYISSKPPLIQMEQLGISFFCVDKDDIAYIDSMAVFNQQTKQWEKNPKLWKMYDEGITEFIKKTTTVENITVENGSGWLATRLNIAGDIGYDKYLSFCLMRDDTGKVICGGGVVQEILDRESIGTTKDDFAPMITEFIKSIKFIPENKSVPCDK